MQNMTAGEAISKCKEVFARFGIPEIVRSDNGIQFLSDFQQFGHEYDFKIITSSPKYPRSNECVEAAVKIAKYIYF